MPDGLGVPVNAPFGSQHQPVAFAFDGLANQQLAFSVSSITMSCIQKIHALVDGFFNRRERISIVDIEAGHAGDRPASQCDGRYKQIRLPQLPKLLIQVL